ncbi:hypothetical protein C6500_13515 [Candidatus Poribacteria bacterium]|nr:MAG: hypothetical protein C6500_13515 [Candidatus Poribacteria bacterium]
MNGLPTTNGTVRSSAIYRTLRNYPIKLLIFIQARLPLSMIKSVACNNGAGGYTERHFIYQTYLIDPQGKIKNPQGKIKKCFGNR